MLRLVHNPFKTKKMCKHAAEKLSFPINYVPDRFKTKQMCDKVILGNVGMLVFTSDCYKDKKCVIMLLIITLMH